MDVRQTQKERKTQSTPFGGMSRTSRRNKMKLTSFDLFTFLANCYQTSKTSYEGILVKTISQEREKQSSESIQNPY